MESIIRNYLKPLKEYYLVLGALFGLLAFLQTAFGAFVSNYFLIGMNLFAIVSTFAAIMWRTLVISYKLKKPNFLTIFYEIFLMIFFFGFILTAYANFTKPFSVCLGLFAGFFYIGILAKIRGYFVIFQKIFKGRWVRRIWRFFFLVGMVFLWSLTANYLILKYFTLDLTKYSNAYFGAISAGNWFFLLFFYITALGTIILWIMCLVDIVKKEPLNSENLSWEKSQLYRIIKSGN